MNSNLVIFLAFMVAACSAGLAPEHFPANVDPKLCPGYPVCDNALLHGTEKIEVLPTYHKTLVPGYSYYRYNQLAHVADEYYTAPRYVVPPTVRTVSPYYRYASVAPVVASNVAPVAPNTVHTINGSPVAPIPPFATLPGLASRVYVGNY